MVSWVACGPAKGGMEAAAMLPDGHPLASLTFPTTRRDASGLAFMAAQKVLLEWGSVGMMPR